MTRSLASATLTGSKIPAPPAGGNELGSVPMITSPTPDRVSVSTGVGVALAPTLGEAEIGTNAYGASGIPPAGLIKKPEDKQVLGPKDAKTNTIGDIFYGSNGYLAIDGYDAYKTWLTDQVEPGPSGKASGDHWANFIYCVRSRRAEDLHCPIEEGHISTTLVHLANTSYRLGRTLKFDPEREQVIGDEEATKMLRGTYRAPYVVPEEV